MILSAAIDQAVRDKTSRRSCSGWIRPAARVTASTKILHAVKVAAEGGQAGGGQQWVRCRLRRLLLLRES